MHIETEKMQMGNDTSSLKILIVDDHYVVRQGLKALLAECFPYVLFGEAANAQDAMAMTHGSTWDLVLLDISIPGRGGIEVLKLLRQDFGKLPVIVISMHPEDQFAVRVLKLGASSYIRKDCAAEELIKGVNVALRGGKYISPIVGEKLAMQLERKEEGLSHESLSDREYQIMCLIASGKTVKEIAGDLSLSVKTISTHRAHILGKMGLRNNAEIMRYALRYSLIDTEV